MNMTQIEKQIGNVAKFAIIGSIVSLLVGGGLLAFGIWAVVALLKHFGVM